jgi:NDP-mannose synthase
MHAVVLAGGRGIRLALSTTVPPKPPMPLGDLILGLLLKQLNRHGIVDVPLAIGQLGVRSFDHRLASEIHATRFHECVST